MNLNIELPAHRFDRTYWFDGVAYEQALNLAQEAEYDRLTTTPDGMDDLLVFAFDTVRDANALEAQARAAGITCDEYEIDIRACVALMKMDRKDMTPAQVKFWEALDEAASRMLPQEPPALDREAE